MSRRHWRTLIALAVVTVIGSVGRIAMAHGLHVFATADGQTISGRAYFAGGGPAKRLNIQILAPDGSQIAQTQTDDAGRFSITATRRCDHRIVAETADGHQAEYVLGAAELSSALLPGTENVDLDAALERSLQTIVSQQLQPLREQLDAYEHQVRLRDVLGGIGYIVGVTGIWFYFRAVRRACHPSPPGDAD